MKTIKYILSFAMALFTLWSCETEDYKFGEIIAPTNLVITPEIVGKTASMPFGNGTGKVNFTAKAENAVSYKFLLKGGEKISSSGYLSDDFPTTGINKYSITVVATGKGGISSSSTIEIEVLTIYEAPAALVTKLNGNGSKTWRIKAEVKDHFGLGPVGGIIPVEWYQAKANEKSSSGMYDDRFTFKSDMSFTHNTGADGTVFGRQVLIEQLNGPGGTADLKDILQYPFATYTTQYSFSENNGYVSLNIAEKGFVGYYSGGNHRYRIFKWKDGDEIILSTADGNNEFEWWFVLVPEN